MRAGFNDQTFPQLQDMLLVTEPEAAAIYTARHLKEVYGVDFLRVGPHLGESNGKQYLHW